MLARRPGKQRQNKSLQPARPALFGALMKPAWRQGFPIFKSEQSIFRQQAVSYLLPTLVRQHSAARRLLTRGRLYLRPTDTLQLHDSIAAPAESVSPFLFPKQPISRSNTVTSAP